jgi:signal transduction histidine kinase
MAMTDIEAQRHRYRSPLAAIIGLTESALLRDDLAPGIVKQLEAIRALAQEALAAYEEANPPSAGELRSSAGGTRSSS